MDEQGILAPHEIDLIRRGNRTMPNKIFTDEELFEYANGKPVTDDRHKYWISRLMKAGIRDQQMEAKNIERFLKATPNRGQVIHLVEQTMLEFYRKTMKGEFGSMMIAVATIMQALEDKGILTREDLNAAREKLAAPPTPQESGEAIPSDSKGVAEEDMSGAISETLDRVVAAEAAAEGATPSPSQPEESPAEPQSPLP